MKENKIRSYRAQDKQEVIDLWETCRLTVPWNDPGKDIEMKTSDSPDLFFIYEEKGKIVGTCMSGYDGHRGWIYYLAVDPEFRSRGIAKEMISHARKKLQSLGCPKINLMVRSTNSEVISFYKKMGFSEQKVLVMGATLDS